MSTSKPLYLQALEALRNREAMFRVAIFTLVTVVFWIGFGIFFSQQKTKVAIDTQSHTTPLNPNIDKSVLEELAGRKIYTDQELEKFPIYDRIIDESKTSKVVIAGSVTDESTAVAAPPESTDLLFENASSSATPEISPETTPIITPETTPEASSSP